MFPKTLFLLLAVIWIPARAQPTIGLGCFDQGMTPVFGRAVAWMGAETGVVVAGTLRQPEHRGSAIQTLRYDHRGELLWRASYQSEAGCFDAAAGLAVSRDHLVYVAGSSWKADWSGTDAVLIQYDDAGKERWRYRHQGPPARNEARAVLIDGHDDVYLVVQAGGSLEARLTLLKFNASGALLWEQSYGEDGLRVGAAALDSSARVVVTGSLCKQAGPAGGPCAGGVMWTAAFDAEGRLAWESRYEASGGGEHQAAAAAAAPDGDVLVGGHVCQAAPPNPGPPGGPVGGGHCANRRMLLLRYGREGGLRWAAEYRGHEQSESYEAAALSVDGNGFAVLAGSGAGQNQGFFVLKFDPEGRLHWVHRYHHESYEMLTGLAQDWQGGIYLAGGSVAESYLEFATVKLDMHGQRQWTARYWGRGARDFTAAALVVGQDGRVVVTGGTLDRIGLPESSIITIQYGDDGTELWIAKENTVQP